ncbi:MAG: hypothetical protein HYZ83_05485 [Candidatus Omnitrophica bacterium]|nr:hypothetical protein [Candidatus Omnitrophota bacterium]
MAGQKDNSYRLMWMLGLALTLPMILLSGPVAGYFVGWWLVNKQGLPSYFIPIAIGIGLLGSGIQSFRLIQKLNQSQKQDSK